MGTLLEEYDDRAWSTTHKNANKEIENSRIILNQTSENRQHWNFRKLKQFFFYLMPKNGILVAVLITENFDRTFLLQSNIYSRFPMTAFSYVAGERKNRLLFRRFISGYL